MSPLTLAMLYDLAAATRCGVVGSEFMNSSLGGDNRGWPVGSESRSALVARRFASAFCVPAGFSPDSDAGLRVLRSGDLVTGLLGRRQGIEAFQPSIYPDVAPVRGVHLKPEQPAECLVY